MKRLVALLMIAFTSYSVFGQRVIYTEPDKYDQRQTNFEIVGKINNNILIYKNLRDNHAISVYDMNMKEIDKVKVDFLPDRTINADFLAYPDFCYMFYQYQKKNIVYCMAAKLDSKAKIIGNPVTIDTTEISFWASNKIYSLINSEDKQRIGIFKINSKNDDRHLLTTSLFDKDLKLLKKSYSSIAMPGRNDFLTEFQLDNEGNFVFARAVQNYQTDNINEVFLITKNVENDEANEYQVDLQKVFLDDFKIKVDNFNRNYILTSFYSKTRVGNIEGLYAAVWDKQAKATKKITLNVFNEDLRNDAKGQNSLKSAFNDYFLQNLIIRRDGGFLVAAESFYTTSRGGGFNRYNFLYGSPFLRPMDYYYFNPYSMGGYGYPYFRNNSFMQGNRYYAQSIAVFSFDSTGKIDWSNVLNKNQYDDQTDAFISYQVLNTGDQLHFLFNQQEKRLQLLTDQSITPSGQITRNPTIKNLDQGYDFMPRYGKQIGIRQMIFPCIYRNYLCFARIDL
ncbi:MAG: hypothetical protein JWQ96_2276 [Segetibacter sp.]|nr:hypothetical protein [Segetibacter sp.]